MRFRKRKRKKSPHLETVLARANYPQFEPGTRVRYISETPPYGLGEYSGAVWIGTEGTIEFNEEWEAEFPRNVVVRFAKDKFPMQLQEGFDYIELVCNPEYLEAL